jgi:hypothetical protein
MSDFNLENKYESSSVPITNLTRGINVKDYGLIGDGVTNDYTALNTLLTSLGSTKTDLYFPRGTYKISCDITIPSTIRVIFENNAILSVDSDKVVTINGEIDAGLYQIFTGSGSFSGTFAGNSIYPHWYGVVANGTTDDSSALRKAMNAESLLSTIPLGVDTNADGLSDGWELTTGSGQTCNTSIDSGYQKLEITASANTNACYISNTSVNYVPCIAGETIIANVIGRKSGNVTFTIVIDYYNASKAYVSQTTSSSYTYETDTLISLTGIVPANIAYYRIRAMRLSPNSGGNVGSGWVKEVFTLRISSSASKRELIFPKGTYNIATHTIIPDWITCTMQNGANFKYTNNTIFMVNGNIKAQPYQIFDTSSVGTLTGTPKVTEVYPEWFGAIADGTTDCATPINSALVFAPICVKLTGLEYLIGSKITIPTNKILQGLNYTKITASANIDMVELYTGSKLSNVYVRNTYATFTKACILLDGVNLVQHVHIDHVKIRNEGTNKNNGVAILLQALSLPSSGTSSYVFRNKFSNIDIDYFEYGIKLDVPDVLSGGLTSAWINANDFLNIYIIHSKWFIYLKGKDASTRACDGNNFHNIHLQYDTLGVSMGCYCQGRFNMFNNIHFWDMGSDYGRTLTSDNAIQFTSDAVSNVVNTNSNNEKYLNPNNRLGHNIINGRQMFSSKFEIFDDFNYQSLTTNDTPWLLYKGSSTASTPVVSVDSRGKIVMTSGSSSGTFAQDASQIICAIPTPPGQTGFVMETRLHINSAITGISVNVGLTDTYNALNEPFEINTSATPIVSNAANGACFVFDDGGSTKQWYACATKDNTDDSGNGTTSVAPVADTWQTLRIVASDDCSVVWFYIDGVLVKTLRNPGIKTNTNMYATVSVNSTTTSSVSVDVDYIYISHNR